MKKIIFILLGFVTSVSIVAQDITNSIIPIKVEKMGEWTPNWDVDGFDASIITKRNPHSNPEKEMLKRYQDSIMVIKRANAEFLEHTLNKNESQKTTASLPTITEGFQTANTQSTPSDNTIAINTQGQIVVSVNSLIRYYSQSGSSISGSMSLSSFFSNPINTSLQSTAVCDPKVIFDPSVNRFIVMAQTCDGSSSTTQVLVAFSKTENPTQGWNYYAFTGNPTAFNANVWFDYPKIGVNNHDLFVSGNFFNDGPQYFYEGSGVYQIDKGIGLSGGTYNTGDAILHSGMSGNPFTLVPANAENPASMGNKMFLISTFSAHNSSNRLLLYELDGPVQSSPSLTRNTLFVSTYSPPVPAVQQGSNTELDLGDARGMDAIYINGTIHFVTHILGNNNYNQIMYDRINFNSSTNSWNVSEYNIESNNVDLAYPSVAHIGYDQFDQSVVVLMNLASPADYPSVGAILIDHNADASPIGVVKAGTGPVSIFPQGGVTRWGDYTGLCKEYGATTPTVWGYGMFGGNSSNVWQNWVSNFITNEDPTNTKNLVSNNESVKVFPNPTTDVWNLTFDTEKKGVFSAVIYSLDGSLVRDLYKQEVNKGTHTFAFNKGAMTTGAYIIHLTLDGKDISSETLMVK